MPTILGAFTVFIFSIVAIEALLQLNLFTGFRQISVLAAFLIIWLVRSGRRTTTNGYLLAIFALTTLLTVGAIITSTPVKNMATGTFMTIEFGLLFYIASSTRVSANEIAKITSIFIAFLCVNSLGTLIGYVDSFPAALREDAGVQGDAGFFASGLNIGIIILLGMNLWRKRAHYLLLAAIFSIVIFLTAIKKAMIISVAIWLIWNFAKGRKKAFRRLMLITGICLLAGTISIGALLANIEDNINYLSAVGVEEHVRLIMYFASFQIALDHFPIGSGAGSFGSLASISGYFSPLYDIYGVSVVPSNTQEAVESGAHTLLDTYWPHILAEAGFIGTILIVYLFLTPIKSSIAALKSHSTPPQIRFCAFIAFCVPLSLLLEGFALYTTEAPSFLIFLGGIAGYCYRITRQQINQSNNSRLSHSWHTRTPTESSAATHEINVE